MIRIEGPPASILVPVQWEDARPLVDCRKNSRQEKSHAKTPRRKEEQGRLGPDQPPRLENAWPEGILLAYHSASASPFTPIRPYADTPIRSSSWLRLRCAKPWRLGVRFSLISSLRRPGVRSSVLGKCCSAQPVHDRFANTDLGHWLNIDSLQRQLVEFSKQRKKPGSCLGQIAVLAQ
jgi:hypothetical protein